MDAFFLPGQREGVFRIDISATVLSVACGRLFCGLVDTERNGHVVRVSIAPTLEALFLNGGADVKLRVAEAYATCPSMWPNGEASRGGLPVSAESDHRLILDALQMA